MDQITNLFLREANNSKEFKEELEIVRTNSSGNIWLIGGFVYKTIASQLYGTQKPEEVDLDFIVESPQFPLQLPSEWTLQTNSYGNPKLVSRKKEIDYIPLRNIYPLIKKQLEPTFDNFLSLSPLNIQYIAYDVSKQKVIGDIGIQALEEKIVQVHNQKFAEYSAHKKGKSLNEMISQKAKELGFRAIFPN